MLLCDNFLSHRVSRSFARSYTEFFSSVLLCGNFLLHRVSQSFARSYTEFFSFVLLCDNFLLHRVSRSFARSYIELLFPPYYFMIIFCYTELHGVLHGVTQSFFSSFVLLCDNFLLHRVARSFVRCFTELLFPPYYFVIIFCCTEFHRVLHGVTQSFFSPSCYFVLLFCYT